MNPQQLRQIKSSQRAAQRLWSQQRKQARKLLDQAYREFLDTLKIVPEQPSSIEESSISTSPPSHPPTSSPGPKHFRERTPSPALVSNPPDLVTSPASPDFEIIYSDITESAFSEQSRPPSPTNSTVSSVEFIDELPPPPPKFYYDFGHHTNLESLMSQFLQRTAPLPEDSFTIGPHDFDLEEIRSMVTGEDPSTLIPVYLSHSRFSYMAPIRYFLISSGLPQQKLQN